jgi:hypothetical protein
MKWGTSAAVCAVDRNLLGDNRDNVHKNTETHANEKVGLEVNIEKLIMFCCLMTRMQGKIMA